MNKHVTNSATLWAETAVAALVGAGLRAVCVAPGSRSTALVLAFSAHPDVTVYRHLDERSAGFFAVGMALALDRPVALLSTSGTATANFFPAIIEARMAQVPLLALTADRPPELRHSGANQTIDQIRLYGEQVLWSVDVPLPEREPPDVALRNLRALMVRAWARADGLTKGPVHLNFPFRKPFEPQGGDEKDIRFLQEIGYPPRIVTGRPAPPEETVEEIASLVEEHERGLIVCGPRCPGGEFPEVVAALSRRSGYPIVADALSGVRYGPWVKDAVVIGGDIRFLGEIGYLKAADLILRFGAAPTSKELNAYLAREELDIVHVRGNGVWADESHRTGLFVQADEVLTCRQLIDRLPERGGSDWQQAVGEREEAYQAALSEALEGEFFDGVVVRDVVELLPDGALLFAGSSLPVRHLDEFGAPVAKRLHTFANRGASGIDGNISTGLGIAVARRAPVTMVVGDVTFYHDMNGLLAAGAHELAATIVLLNNGGGGIFRRLPVAQFEPPFTELFLTPHGLDFTHAARMYGFDHVRVEDDDAFRRHFAAAVAQPGRRIIEVVTDGERDYERRREVMRAV
ncbi:MAG: 2-succinyl-5-enolpyruvyl-6-hydroxy-3-cyclohexene-1-carboxylic-acid synthase [Chloroflexota bacterium]